MKIPVFTLKTEKYIARCIKGDYISDRFDTYEEAAVDSFKHQQNNKSHVIEITLEQESSYILPKI